MAGEGSDRNPESRHLNIIKAVDSLFLGPWKREKGEDWNLPSLIRARLRTRKINQTDFQTTRLQMVTKRKAGSLDDVLIGSWEPEAL